MDQRAKTSPAPGLTREVEPPQRYHTGLGVMVVASAAMFFAVASSAFLLRARMADERCPHFQQAVSQPSDAQPEIKPAGSAGASDCGQAVYRNNPDGSVTVYFDLCPAPDARSAPASTGSGAIEGVEVGAIHPR